MNERKTALVLSGGGSRGAYESGAWQALCELGIKIDMVVGVSVGAINAAMVVQGDVNKTNQLWREMKTSMVFDVNEDAQLTDFAKEFVVNRGAGTQGMQAMMREYFDEDKIRAASMDLGLVTVEWPSRKAHYLWKEDIPYGKLSDYITASASAFPAIHPHRIDGKDYIDGGYENNLPVPMAIERGATRIIAVYLDAFGKFYPEQLEGIEDLTFIKSSWDLGDFLIFDTKNQTHLIRLGYLDTMKAYGIFDGLFFTFAKGDFDKRTMRQADVAARIFDLDAEIIYKKDFFLEALAGAVATAQSDMDLDLSLDFQVIGKLKEIIKIANRKTVTLFIADNLKINGGKSRFLSRHALRLLKDEVNAARFLVKYEII